MEKTISQITREAMFDLVWTKLVITVAKELVAANQFDMALKNYSSGQQWTTEI